MSDVAETVRNALAVYLERGRRALELLEKKSYDEASELLRRRTEAFHNFRAVDVLAQRSGFDVAEDEAAKEIWIEIRRLEKSLAEQLQIAHKATAELYKKIREARAKIGAFRSEKSATARFEKTA